MNWLKKLFSRRPIDGDLSAEIQEHLVERAGELVAQGMSREEATYAARREFGNVLQIEESSREVWHWPALGAGKRQVFRMVIGQGLRLALAGLVIGVATALVLARMVASQSHLLYGVGPGDPLTFAVVSLVLTGAAVLACYIPARRATKVDPIVALRYE